MHSGQRQRHNGKMQDEGELMTDAAGLQNTGRNAGTEMLLYTQPVNVM